MRAVILSLWFVCTWVTAGFLLFSIQGQVFSHHGYISLALAIGLTALVAHYWKHWPKSELTLSPFDWTMIFVFICFCYRHFFWVYYPKGGIMSTLNVNNYGDLPLHLTYINSFVKGLTFWPQNPIYA
ncbi:MAG: hypothetical protein IT289_06910, partial [Oligoflexia bacterium]|nr:hypothetical protein [Oligoflexia bacterium]